MLAKRRRVEFRFQGAHGQATSCSSLTKTASFLFDRGRKHANVSIITSHVAVFEFWQHSLSILHCPPSSGSQFDLYLTDCCPFRYSFLIYQSAKQNEECHPRASSVKLQAIPMGPRRYCLLTAALGLAGWNLKVNRLSSTSYCRIWASVELRSEKSKTLTPSCIPCRKRSPAIHRKEVTR